MATVEAAALKGLDRTLASGTHYNSARLPLPSIAGGDGVARLDDGRLVYANAQPGQGMMAEKTLINPAAAVELPKGIDPVFAAAVPNPAQSAWLSFEHRARMQEGQHVLVLGHRELLSHTRVATFFARARLCYGEWLRRTDRRAEAGTQLRAAFGAFSAMGANAFADRARRELEATGEQVRFRRDDQGLGLTPQEHQIAQLARTRRTNPEIGANCS